MLRGVHGAHPRWFNGRSSVTIRNLRSAGRWRSRSLTNAPWLMLMALSRPCVGYCCTTCRSTAVSTSAIDVQQKTKVRRTLSCSKLYPVSIKTLMNSANRIRAMVITALPCRSHLGNCWRLVARVCYMDLLPRHLDLAIDERESDQFHALPRVL